MVAPHPDDESLAAGGLLQRAKAAQAQVRILFATDGDDNPWPQRFLERRWKIGRAERERWGTRRRAEAIAALQTLGWRESCARFLGLPDQGITQMLLETEQEPMRIIRDEIEDWQPTILILPSRRDLHPDHNALAIFAELALLEISDDQRPRRQVEYVVHAGRNRKVPSPFQLHLRAGEVTKKRDAILCHESQMALSRKRFAAYAKEVESFAPASTLQPEESHPIREMTIEAGALRLTLQLPKKSPRAGKKTKLFVAIESVTEGSVRWLLPLPTKSRRVHIRDAATGGQLRLATVRLKGRRAEINLPIAAMLPARRIFVKLERRRLFFDSAGWRELVLARPPVPAHETAVRRDHSPLVKPA